MKHVCAWCGCDLGEDSYEPREAISHGICPTCEQRVRAQIKEVKAAAGRQPTR